MGEFEGEGEGGGLESARAEDVGGKEALGKGEGGEGEGVGVALDWGVCWRWG